MFIRPALLAHEFLLFRHPATRPRLDRRWRDIHSTLDIQANGDVAELLGAADVPPLDHATLAHGKRPTTGPDLYEMLLSGTGDAACLGLLLAPNDQSRTWTSIEAELAPLGHGAPGAEHLGTVYVYVGLVDASPDTLLDDATAGTIAAALGREIPDSGNDGWTRRWTRTAQGFLLWEVPSAEPAIRRLVLIGALSAERDLDHFSWTLGDREPGPFIRYLLDGAKLRYQHAVHRTEAAGIRLLASTMDRAVDDLLTLHNELSTGSARQMTSQLVYADAELARLQTGSAGVITTLARLRTIARSVDAAAANLKAVLPNGSGVPGPLASDLALVDALRSWVTDDIALLETSADRADRVATVTTVVVQRRLGTNHQQLLLVQASVVSAILMILAAVQAFGTDLRIPHFLHLPTIAFLGSIALALPTAVLRWSRGVPRDLPLRTIDFVAAGLTGSSTGWLGSGIASYLASGHPLDPAPTQLAAALGALATAGLAWLRWRRLRNPGTQRT